MWFFKSRFEKLKREDVVNSIAQLQTEQANLEDKILASAGEINALIERGKKERDHDVKVFLAKKIESLKEERRENIKRATFLMYNIKLLGKLKKAIDDNEFFKTNSKVPLNSLLKDQKGLAVFLNKVLKTRIKAEDVMTSADDVFADVEAAYDPNERIYGVDKSEDQLLAVFEEGNQIALEEGEAQAESEQEEPVEQTAQSDGTGEQ